MLGTPANPWTPANNEARAIWVGKLHSPTIENSTTPTHFATIDLDGGDNEFKRTTLANVTSAVSAQADKIIIDEEINEAEILKRLAGDPLHYYKYKEGSAGYDGGFKHFGTFSEEYNGSLGGVGHRTDRVATADMLGNLTLLNKQVYKLREEMDDHKEDIDIIKKGLKDLLDLLDEN